MRNLQNKQEKRILVVDDDQDCSRAIERTLSWEGYQVMLVDDGSKALEVLDTWCPDLVLLDVQMPGLGGYQTLKGLRKGNHRTSVIFISGKNETEDIIRGLDAGADDYVCKPFHPFELLARVKAQLRIKELNDQLVQANDKLQELIDIDDLTGLFNMRSLYSKLDNEISRANRYGRRVCVLMMDLDNFKNVNDDHDHLYGSFVISEVGRLIKENMRRVDFAARYGGDEFLIVLTEIDVDGAKAFASRLLNCIRKHDFENDEYSTNITASIGVAISPLKDANLDSKALVKASDSALYEAKNTGRNKICFQDAIVVKSELEKKQSKPAR